MPIDGPVGEGKKGVLSLLVCEDFTGNIVICYFYGRIFDYQT